MLSNIKYLFVYNVHAMLFFFSKSEQIAFGIRFTSDRDYISLKLFRHTQFKVFALEGISDK